jgi:putative transcriptional regulator
MQTSMVETSGNAGSGSTSPPWYSPAVLSNGPKFFASRRLYRSWACATHHLGAGGEQEGTKPMAVTRMTLAAILAAPPQVNEEALAAVSDAEIARQMVEDGQDPNEDLGLDTAISPALIRDRLGMTQERFAGMLGIPLATLRAWEQGGTPDPVARALLRIVAREPEAALRALGT